jgi:hypothetical protein
MTYSATTEIVGTERTSVRRVLVPTGVAVFVAAAALTVYGAHDMTEVAVVLAILVAVMAGVYGYLLPRKLAQESAGGAALTLSIIAAVLLLPAFWSGLPLALGVAGAMLGYAGRNAAKGSGKCVAALVIGALAAIGYFAVYVLDTLHQMGIG